MYSLAATPDMPVTHDLAAHVFNPDILLRETAAWAIYKLKPATYLALQNRLSVQAKHELDKIIGPMISATHAHKQESLMVYQIIFLKQTKAFGGLPGVLLSELAGAITIERYKKGDIIITPGLSGNTPIYIVFNGLVEWHSQEGEFWQADNSELIGESVILDTDVHAYTVIARENTELYRIDKDKFYRLMASRPKLMQQFLENLNRNQRRPAEEVLAD
jgi:hypothetical protein